MPEADGNAIRRSESVSDGRDGADGIDTVHNADNGLRAKQRPRRGHWNDMYGSMQTVCHTQRVRKCVTMHQDVAHASDGAGEHTDCGTHDNDKANGIHV